jgi:hypothetical protein
MVRYFSVFMSFSNYDLELWALTISDIGRRYDTLGKV